MTDRTADKIAAEAFAPQFLRSKLTEDEQIELHAHLQEICSRHIAPIIEERDAANDRMAAAVADYNDAREQLERAREALERLATRKLSLHPAWLVQKTRRG